MAAPPIPPIRLGLIGTGLAVEKLHWPALCGLADRYEVTAFTDSSAEQSRRFADYSGADPARSAADRAALLARDDVDAVLISVPIPHLYEVARDALTAGKDVLCEKPAGAVQAANSTIDAPSDLTLNLVFTDGAIGNYTASYPEILVPPEPNEMRSSSDATTHTTVFRGVESPLDDQAAVLAPGQRISSSASFAA